MSFITYMFILYSHNKYLAIYLPRSTLQYFVNRINHAGVSLRCEFIRARVGKFSWLPAKVNELIDRERQWCADYRSCINHSTRPIPRGTLDPFWNAKLGYRPRLHEGRSEY